MRHALRLAAVLPILTLSALPALGSFAPQRALDPRSYTSPSGSWSLYVNPSAPTGAGKATYTLSYEGETRWSRTHKVTFEKAIVTDGGDSVGYGYTWGRESNRGSFFTAKLSWEGELSFVERLPRKLSRHFHTDPDPCALDLLHVPAAKRALVRIADPDHNRASEEWRVFDLREGKLVLSCRPRDRQESADPLQRMMAARVVDATPLVLVQWHSWTRGKTGPHSEGTRYGLLHLDGRCVWNEDLPDDYSGLEYEEMQSFLWTGTIVDVGAGRFSVRHYADEKVVTYAVRRAEDDSWMVVEVERGPYETPAREPAVERMKGIQDVAARHLGSFDLVPDEPPASAVRYPGRPSFDEDGHLAFVSSALYRAPVTLKVIDQEGSSIVEYPLEDVSEERGNWYRTVWDGRGCYLLLNRSLPPTYRAEVWAIEKETGIAERRCVLSGKWVSGLESFGDGGFAVLAGDLRLYASDGSLRRVVEDLGCHRGKIEGWTRLTDGRFVMLVNHPPSIRFLEADGGLGNVILLEEVWGRKPGNLGRVAADQDGGVMVVDSSSTILRLRADGSVRGSFVPKFPDGRQFSFWSSPRVDGEGRLWVSDRYALLRLDEEGVVDRILGDPPGLHRLGEIVALALGPSDRVYAAGERTGAVHVFRADGTFVHRCEPDPEDFSQRLSWVDASLTVDPEGRVVLSDGNPDGSFIGPPRYVRFSAEGKRLGTMRFGLDVVRERCHARRPDEGYLVVGYETAFLVDGEGKRTRTIDRRPGGAWLQSPKEAAVAADGSFVIFTAGPERQGVRWPPSVHLYDRDGEALRGFALPSKVRDIVQLAYDGEWIVTNSYEGVLVLDAADGTLQRLTLPAPLDEQASHWQPLLPTRTRELWLFDGERTLHRFALPE